MFLHTEDVFPTIIFSAVFSSHSEEMEERYYLIMPCGPKGQPGPGMGGREREREREKE